MTKLLKEKAGHAFFWDMFGLFAKQGINFIVTIFLARLLLPAEFGLVAMALVFIAISQIFAEFGFTSALIQNKENTSLTYSTIFYVNIIVGILFFLLFWILAPAIGKFYGHPEISTLVRYLSISFILNSVNQVQTTILRKNIDFKRVTVTSAIAQTLSGIAAIFLAFRGWGVYALVVQNIFGSILGTLMLWRIAEWKPTWEFSWGEVKKLSGFSTYIFLSNFTAKIALQLDTLVVGKVFSPTTLGLYSRASSLNALVTMFSSTSISRVAFPLMSHIQDDRDRFVRAYFKMLELVAFSSFGLSGALIFSGADIITILFGENWTSSIFIFQILVFKSFTYPVSLLILSVFWAGGKTKESFWFGVISKVIQLVPLFFAIWWGFNPFLYAVVVASIINWFLSNWFVTISFKINLLDQCKVIAVYFSLFLVLGLLMYAMVQYFDIGFPFSGIITGIVFVGIYVGVNALLKTGGYVTTFDYVMPLWRQVREKLHF